MKHNRLLSLLLALILLAGAAVPARCAGQPTVICETGVKDGVVSLSLEDLDGSAVYGVQVELVLEGEYPRSVFTPSSRAAYSPGCVVETRRDTTSVTVYLTGSAALNRDGTVDLGELDLGVNELVSWDALPESASVILLNQQLRPMTGSMSGSFPVTATAPAGTSFAPSPSQPESPKPQQPGTTPVPAVLPFADVAAGNWYRSAVEYVYAHAIMSGTAAAAFSPNQATTRGMIVTMLHRLEGSPAAPSAAFYDVSASAYYAAPVAWASANGIVTGVGNGFFSPDTAITREQLAAILYRYAQYKGLDVAARADLGTFPDAASVALYAADPMSWAVGVGLIAGSDGRLDPMGNATRAQVAVIFQRLCANLLGMT